MSARSFATFMAVLAVVALLGFGLLSEGSGAMQVGEPAPGIELPRLEGSGTGSFADYRGQWLLVNLWASWCDPCRSESPDLQRYYERHRGPDFALVGIDTRDLTDDALAFVAEFSLTYPMLRDGDGAAAEELGATGVPETYLLDPDGNVALVRPGPVDLEYLQENVTPLIEGRGS